MMKKAALAFVVLALGVVTLWGQATPSVATPRLHGSGLQLDLQNPPLPPASGSASRIGDYGMAFQYYWVVAEYTVGQAVAGGPYVCANTASSLSSSSYCVVSWAPAAGATSYDVLLTSTPAAPSGSCNCAVATGVATTTYTDQSGSLGAYTVSPVDANQLSVGIFNVGAAGGNSQLVLVTKNGSSPFGGGGQANVTPSVPTPATAGKLYLLSSGLNNFLVDNGTKVWSPSAFDTNAVAFGADATCAVASVTNLQNSIAAVAITSGQRMYMPSGCYLTDPSSVLHIDREMILEGAGSGEDTPATTIKLGPKAYAVVDRVATSPDGGRGDWSQIRSIRFTATTISCTATASSGTYTACNGNPATVLSLASGDPVTIMGSNGAPWQLNAPRGATVASMTSNTLTLNSPSVAAFSGTVTVMADGPLVGTGTTTNGGTSITGVTNCSQWAPGDPIEAPGIPPLTNSNGTQDANFLIAVNCGTNTLTLFSGTGVSAGTAQNLYKGPLPDLMAKATTRLDNLSVAFAAGHGIDFNCSASYSPSTICDGWKVDAVRIVKTGGLNFHVQGADGNAGVATGLYMAYGAEGCMRADDFLGGTYQAGECANNGGPGWGTTNANAVQLLLNPYQESGYTFGVFSGVTLIVGGNATKNYGTGNFIATDGTMSSGFQAQNYGEATASVTNNSPTITNVTNISHWKPGDTIVGQCIPTSSVVNTTDGVGTLTLAASVGGAAKNATCTQNTVQIAHTRTNVILGTKSGLTSVGGESYSLNGSTSFLYENTYNDYYDSLEWGWTCKTWRNSTKAFCWSTDWAVGKDVPPNAGTGAYGNNGGRIKFPSGFYLGSGANAKLFTENSGVTTAPTTGSFSQGSWAFPGSPTSSSTSAAYVQVGGNLSIASGHINITAGQLNFTSADATALTCAPNNWVTGTDIENDTIIFTNNLDGTGSLSRPALATATETISCGRLPKAHTASTITCSPSTNTCTVNTGSSTWANGDYIAASCIATNTWIQSGGGTGTITLSQNTTGTCTAASAADPTLLWASVPLSPGLPTSGSATGCTTGSSAGSTCTTTVTWGTALPSSTYKATCTGYTPSGAPYIAGYSSRTTTQITVTTSNGQGSQAIASGYSTIDCLALP